MYIKYNMEINILSHSEYFQLRTIHHRKKDWADVKFSGAVMTDPVQQDGSSCGVIVIMVL